MLTGIRRVINNAAFTISLRNYEYPGQEAVVVPPGGEAPLAWNVPWCASPRDFNDGHRIVLRYGDGGGVVEHSIWQEWKSDGDYVRFTDGSGGETQYTYRDALQSAARMLATDERGTLFAVTSDSDTILRIKPVLGATWVILTRA